jgi:hypothetical protein
MHNRLQAYEGVFDPDDVRLLTAAFDEAWRVVEDSGAFFASNGHAESAKEVLARRIIEMARLGERDHIRLRDDALLYLARSDLNATSL